MANDSVQDRTTCKTIIGANDYSNSARSWSVRSEHVSFNCEDRTIVLKFFRGRNFVRIFRIIIQHGDCIVSSRKAQSIILITERRVRSQCVKERELVLKLYIYTGLNWFKSNREEERDYIKTNYDLSRILSMTQSSDFKTLGIKLGGVEYPWKSMWNIFKVQSVLKWGSKLQVFHFRSKNWK